MMHQVGVVVDSNSGISQAMGQELGIYVLPMPFTINNQEYFEDINITHDEFYAFQENDATIFTSQPAVGDVVALWDQALEHYDEIVYIPMSSGLSGSCQTALMLAKEYHGRVEVIDSQRISVLQYQDALNALQLSREGKSAKEIKDILEKHKFESSIYIAVTTLEYLKKGGRITPAVATLGGLLKIKPILSIQGEKLDSFDKTRTITKAEKIMIQALKHDIETRIDQDGHGENVNIYMAYTKDKEGIEAFKEKVQEAFPNHTILCHELALSIACHTGPGALGLGCAKKLSRK